MVKDNTTFIGTIVKGNRKGNLQINLPKNKTIMKLGDYVYVKLVTKKMIEDN